MAKSLEAPPELKIHHSSEAHIPCISAREPDPCLALEPEKSFKQGDLEIRLCCAEAVSGFSS